jgi:uncharacterized protein YndB with AHSA1/START domain
MRRTDTASLVIAASPDAIYRAFVTPEALMAWLPPEGMTGRVLEYQFREGGAYRIELAYRDASSAAKTTDRTDVSAGRFVALEPGRRIVQSVEFESTDAAFAGEMIMTWTFEPADGGTRVVIVASNVPEGISQADHDEGLRSSLAQLARYVITAG